MTHNPEKLVPLNWNQFPLDRFRQDDAVTFDVTVTTRSLSLEQIPDGQEYHHERIMRLHNEGLSDKEISDYLNNQNITSRLVWITRKKLKDRENRKSDDNLRNRPMSFYLKIKNDDLVVPSMGVPVINYS